MTQREWSASGWAARLAGVSMTLGSTVLQRTPCDRYSTATALAKASTAALAVDVAGRAGERRDRRPGRDADHRAAAGRHQVRQRGRRDQVGRPQVERQHPLEVVDRRLVHQPAAGVPADEVDHRAQRRRRFAGGGLDRLRRARRVGQVRGDPDQSGRRRLRPGPGFRSGTTTRQPASTNAVTTAPPSPPKPPVTKTLRSPMRPTLAPPTPRPLRRSWSCCRDTPS